MSDDLSNLGKSAIAYAELGWPVFPCWWCEDDGNCACGSKPDKSGKPTCSEGKHPITSDGFKSASQEESAIRAWWTKYPKANIGTPTAGKLVLDIDGSGNAWLARDPDLTLQLATGPMQRTPRGGLHYIYKKPNGKHWKNTAGKIAFMVDTRSDGGYILLAPSSVKGKSYGFVPGHELEAPEHLPEPPAWLVQVLDSLDSGGSLRSQAGSGVVGNQIPPGTRNDTLARLAGNMRRSGMGFEEIASALTATNRTRCLPPLSEKEISAIAASICRYEPDQVTVAVVEDWAKQDERNGRHAPLSIKATRAKHPKLSPPVIHGLLREGETMNIIAPPKSGKSWLVLDLAITVASGDQWLDTFSTVAGRVLVIDNELHGSTIIDRFDTVAKAKGLDPDDMDGKIELESMRGKLRDLKAMKAYFDVIEPGTYKMIVLDAFYRFLPAGTDENDNGAISALYNLLDSYAERLKCCFVLIHHSSKGQQGQKDVTDVGAGAGAQSRAADTHLIMRRHKEDQIVVLDAVIRSWPPMQPFAIRREHPLWKATEGVDISALAGKPETKEEPPELTPEDFKSRYIQGTPRSVGTIELAADKDGVYPSLVKRYIQACQDAGLIFRHELAGGGHGWATVPQPEAKEEPAATPQEASKRELVLSLRRDEPGLSKAEIARRAETSRSYVTEVLGSTDE